MRPLPRSTLSHHRGSPRRTVLFGIALLAGTAACGGPLTEDRYGTEAQALSGSDAVTRGEQWVTAKVPYCQSPNGQSDPDPSCSAVCMRPTESAWDPYRSDCSGFVSWAWALPAPGRTTSEFAPAVTDITKAIDGNALEPGDALNIPGDHMVLFVSWITPGQNANFMEEPGCSANPPYAHAFTSDVTISGSSVTIAYEGQTFTAIRYTALTGQGDAGTVTVADAGISCFVTSLGESGDCLLTTRCASLGGTSTPGYCPGAADIQCCTGATSTTMPGCTSNAECSGSTPTCDTGTGTCRACTATSDCSQGVCATSAGDPHAGKCVQCTGNADCTAPDLCALSSDTCVQCLSDAQCPELTPVCQSGTCRACGTNADCTGSVRGAVCQTSTGSCVACTQADTSACKGTTPVCDESISSCVECLTDADCHSATQPACNAATHTCGCDSNEPSCATSADAGADTRDAGTNTRDAGTFVEPGAIDAGTNRQTPGGCATGSTDLAMVGLALGLALMHRRPRRIAV